MTKTSTIRNRLSVDVTQQEHMEIKLFATYRGETIRDYVMDCIKERLVKEKENAELLEMTTSISPVLKKIWNNKKDSAYDKL